MEMLELYRKGQVLAVFEANERPVEIGRAMGCDIVVDDPHLADRHFLVARRRGTLVAYDVSPGGGGRFSPVPLGKPWPLGRDYTLRRRHAQLADVIAGADVTAALGRAAAAPGRLRLSVGHGCEAREYAVLERPLRIGRDADNDVVIGDGAVSAHHCRLEPSRHGVLVRDLSSRNGTFVNGVCIERARLRVGASLRVGRTDMRLLAIEHEDDQRGRGPVLIARSSRMMTALSEARRLAQLRYSVLVWGETGVGKEGVALTIHEYSPRSNAPFVTLNAGGIARELVESELFGHERGAFTGAVAQHLGVFEQAHGGTLFLDEVGELPLSLQARLLRVLEDGEVRRLGSERTRHVDVRLVCATHRDLRAMVSEGSFRQDLYYRIARLVIELPPLRERSSDIAALTEHFLGEMSEQIGPRKLAPDALAYLKAYAWPGNVRELRNVLTCAAAQSGGDTLDAAAIKQALELVGCVTRREADADTLHATLRRFNGNISAAARALGMPRTTLRDRLRPTAETREQG